MASYVHEPPARNPYLPRRCRAYHPQLMVQCEGESSEATTHIEDHWAGVPGGSIVRWDDLVAVPADDIDRQAEPDCLAYLEGDCVCVLRRGHAGNHSSALDGIRIRWNDSAPGARYRDFGPVPPEPASERQVGGEHYRRYKFQPWDIVDEYGLSFYEGSALKYLLRRKDNRLEDLKKCRHYLDKLIEIEEGN